MNILRIIIIIIIDCAVLFLMNTGFPLVEMSSVNKSIDREDFPNRIYAVPRRADFSSIRMSVRISNSSRKYFSFFGIGPNASMANGAT